MVTEISATPDLSALTIDEFVRLYARLGVPHFQRGLVWTNEARGRLLESLFYDTPCGSVILWEPVGRAAGVDAPGLPLPGNREADITDLVVDGQQRLRALRAVFGTGARGVESDETAEVGLADDGETEAPDAVAIPRRWCMNLQALPELASQLDGRLADAPLFLFVRDPARVTAKDGKDHRNPRYRYNLWPLQLLYTQDLEALRAALAPYELKTSNPKSGAADAAFGHLGSIVERVHAMRQRRLVVVRRREADGFHLSDMVKLYNRINSAGVRVEAEERAFATLVELEPSTGVWVGRLFESIRGDGLMNDATDRLSRDDELQRAHERRFGFKLFLRTLVHVTAYHFDYSLGSDSFSFKVLGGSELARRFSQHRSTERPPAQEMQRIASDIVLTLHRTLRDSLCCDGHQFLPDASSLVVVEELLVAYSGVRGGTVANTLSPWLLLALQIADASPKDLLGLVSSMRAAPNLRACRKLLLEAKCMEITPRELEKRLESSNSLQDRFVLLLYWLLRRHGARDLSYENAAETAAPKEGAGQVRDFPWRHRREPEISMTMHGRECAPQKQHIVPYAILRELFGDTKRGRAASSLANNIGNLTYISAELNHFDGGIGSKPMKWASEPEENLRRHLLLAPGVERDNNPIQMHFDVAVDKDRSVEQRRKAFDELCKARRMLIAEALIRWRDELRAAAGEEVIGREEPEPRRFARTVPDRIRSMGYDEGLEDAILSLVTVSNTEGFRSEDGVPILRFGGGPKKRRTSLTLRGEDSILLSVARADREVLQEFLPVHPEQDGNEFELPAHGDDSGKTAELLRGIRKAFAARRTMNTQA